MGNVFQLLCLSLVMGLGVLSAKCSPKLEKKISHLAKSRKYRQLGVVVRKNLNKKCTLGELDAIASSVGCKKLRDAIFATRRLYGTHRNVCIRRPQFLQDALFTLTKLPSLRKSYSYLTRKQTGLRDTIEYDPHTKKAFILLDRHKRAWVGKGYKKRVNKAILFDIKNPKVVARAEQSAPMKEEIKVCKKMRNTPGVINMQASTTYSKNRQTFRTLYLDLYEPGSLKHALAKKKKFTLTQVTQIMHRLLVGLKSFHSRKIVHRDIHIGNCFISKSSKKGTKIDAVLADLGRAMSIKKAKGIPPQGAKIYYSPESIEMEKMRHKDYFASDIYALGCVFYQLLFKKQAPWQGTYLRDRTLPAEKKREMLVQELNRACEKKWSYLKGKKQLSRRQAAQYLVFKMLQVDPKERGSASSLASIAKAIAQRSR
ncbi:MAG: protein kinase [Verrucomicrobia bacterium]|nr:protein kinase [Verrucomicrobiota bacterium]